MLLLVTQRTGPLMLGSVEKYCFSVAVKIISDSESSIVDQLVRIFLLILYVAWIFDLAEIRTKNGWRKKKS